MADRDRPDHGCTNKGPRTGPGWYALSALHLPTLKAFFRGPPESTTALRTRPGPDPLPPYQNLRREASAVAVPRRRPQGWGPLSSQAFPDPVTTSDPLFPPWGVRGDQSVVTIKSSPEYAPDLPDPPEPPTPPTPPASPDPSQPSQDGDGETRGGARS